MKQPIDIDSGMLTSMLVALMLQQDKTEFTLSFEEFESLGLEDLAIETTCETDGGTDERPSSVTVTIISAAEAMRRGGYQS